MIVRPLKAAKPATTSAIDARSQVTVMRGSSRPARDVTSVLLTSRTSGRAARGAGAASSYAASSSSSGSASAAVTTRADWPASEAQPWKPAASPVNDTRIWSPCCSME
ncbi:MAG: hypothetical protein H6Q02_2559 [Acidobacteria bacterium]|nr:hypothetical protein [Acidobacteriota bacterium]